jgi:hypothetical protein
MIMISQILTERNFTAEFTAIAIRAFSELASMGRIEDAPPGIANHVFSEHAPGDTEAYVELHSVMFEYRRTLKSTMSNRDPQTSMASIVGARSKNIIVGALKPVSVPRLDLSRIEPVQSVKEDTSDVPGNEYTFPSVGFPTIEDIEQRIREHQAVRFRVREDRAGIRSYTVSNFPILEYETTFEDGFVRIKSTGFPTLEKLRSYLDLTFEALPETDSVDVLTTDPASMRRLVNAMRDSYSASSKSVNSRITSFRFRTRTVVFTALPTLNELMIAFRSAKSNRVTAVYKSVSRAEVEKLRGRLHDYRISVRDLSDLTCTIVVHYADAPQKTTTPMIRAIMKRA